MNRLAVGTNPAAPRVLLALLWGSVCSAFMIAPWLESAGHGNGAALLYAFFAPVCHQDAARSFAWCGHAWAVCHRCAGIYLGLFWGSLIPFELGFLLDAPPRRRLWALVATGALILDSLAPLAGLWRNSAGSRFFTGLLFGTMLASLLVPAVAEFVNELRSGRRGGRADVFGGLS
jgi:uncharacterized membrane protein